MMSLFALTLLFDALQLTFAGHAGDCPYPPSSPLPVRSWPGVNLDFEDPSCATYCYITPTDWNSVGDLCHGTSENCLISAGGISSWGNVAPSSGNQYITLQLQNAKVEQRIELPVAVRETGFNVSFDISRRNGDPCEVTVFISGTPYFSGTNYGPFITQSFDVTAGNISTQNLVSDFVLSFKNTATSGAGTFFLDNVHINALPPPPPPPTTLRVRGEDSQIILGPAGNDCTLQHTAGAPPTLTSSCAITQPGGRRLQNDDAGLNGRIASLEERLKELEAENVQRKADLNALREKRAGASARHDKSAGG